MMRLKAISALAVASAAMSYGQAVSVNGGSLQGSITDPTGAVVPNATVVVKATDTGVSKTLTTDSAGFYSIGPLNPGAYTVTVTQSGFETLTVSTVVRTGTATSGNFKLTVGNSGESVEVTAGELQVNTDQISVSGVVDRQQIETLPVNGRNILDYAQLQPGVILQPGESFDPTKAGYSAISVSGVGGRTTRILLDGQDITDETVGTTIFNVPAGAIQEFQINRSTQDVSGEVTSTGQVLVSTQSGTNSIHGNAFYNFQDARAGAATVEDSAPPFQRNQFGGYAGGPVIKDKLFFFGGIERIKQSEEDAAIGDSLFQSILTQYPEVPAPFRDTFSMGRLDYNGPHAIHAFVRGVYSVNSDFATFGFTPYQIYQNRDNVPGFVGGLDFVTGHFTHSFRGGYEKFHNILGDGTAALGSSIYNPSMGPNDQVTINGDLNFGTNFYAGPNFLAPQQTFQTDKQFRYDGTWTKGAHTIKFGFDMNRLFSGGFAAFYGPSLYAELAATSSYLPAGGNPSDPTAYAAEYYLIGNGNGFFSERPGFGLVGGLDPSWRFASYVADTWKAKPYLTLTAGIRWSVDTDRANQDLPTPLCSSVDPSLQFPGCTGNTPLFDQFQAGLGGKTNQPYKDFGPQAGFVFSPGSHKLAIRGGGGIFFESSVFNNTTNSRTGEIQTPIAAFNLGFAGYGSSSITLPGYGVVTTAPDGTPVSTILTESIAQASPELNAIKAEYQLKVKNVPGSNPSYIGNGNGLYASSLYAAPYSTPYSIQLNFGAQYELSKGLILSADYVHNATLKIPLSVDVNHNGAARTLNTAAAQNAIVTALAATAADGSGGACGNPFAVTLNQALTPGGCPNGGGVDPVTGKPNATITIENLAGYGLDSGTVYNQNYADSYAGHTVATGAAFPGTNPNLGTGKFILPVGKSGYNALQAVLQQQKQHPLPGILSSNLTVSYNYSKIVTATGGGTADQFFAGTGPWNNDNPTEYIGRSNLDHTNELSFGGSFAVKYGVQVGAIGHFFSAPSASLTLAPQTTQAQIFQTDLNGDGTIGDLLPGTSPGYYEHEIKGAGLAKLINTYNTQYAGTPTPAGNALINAGLLNQQQLVALGGVQQQIPQVQNSAINNPALRTFDMNASYPIKFTKFREGLSLTPGVAMYNVFNMSNYNALSGSLAGQPGTVNGPNTFAALNSSNRITRNSGTFDQGGPRTTEFQLKLNF
jgi:hypothetical protein